MSKISMGELICSLRKEKGLTQSELAEKLNVTDKAVSKWERNLSCPDIGTLPTLAELLGTSADELLNASGKAKGTKGSRSDLVSIVLRAISLAMGVAVTMISLLGQLDAASGVSMLGIGLACLGIDSFREK